MELRRQTVTASMVLPGNEESVVETEIEIRWDPLTGHSSRILPERGLMPAHDFDLEGFAAASRSSCPFCPERLDQSTPRLDPRLELGSRIGRGQARLFPNLHAYGAYSSVSIYSADLHYLPLAKLTQPLVADNLATQVEYARAVMRIDPEARWASVNANHMLPSGSSLFHPHLQGIVDRVPTTMQQMLASVRPETFEAYLALEREAGERYLGTTGRVHWLVSFAPIAPGELRAFVPEVSSTAELSPDLVVELARGITTALAMYSDLGFESFNLALYGAPPATAGYPLNLRLACRSNLRPLYRSDSTFLERLHWEGAVDLPPEMIAERARGRFGAVSGNRA
jgi:UDPglucose--hexose-1-phosphate uridylyltransferase